MQVLNISAITRPSKSITTIPYTPLDVIHCKHTLKFKEAVLRNVLVHTASTDAVQHIFNFKDAKLWSAVTYAVAEHATIQHDFTIRDAVLYSLVTHKVTLSVENAAHDFKWKDAVLQLAVIRLVLKPDSTQHTFSFKDCILGG